MIGELGEKEIKILETYLRNPIRRAYLTEDNAIIAEYQNGKRERIESGIVLEVLKGSALNRIIEICNEYIPEYKKCKEIKEKDIEKYLNNPEDLISLNEDIVEYVASTIQRELFKVIEKYKLKNTYLPTISDIVQAIYLEGLDFAIDLLENIQKGDMEAVYEHLETSFLRLERLDRNLYF